MAKIDFPNPTDTNPDTGNAYSSGWYNPANGVTYVYANNTWSAATVANSDFDSRYVEIGGDTMVGSLRLPGGGGDADALQKREIEALITTLDDGLDGRYVEVSGDHMSGPLTIGPDTDPTNAVVNIGSTALGDGDIQVGGDALANAGVNIYKTGTIVSTAASNTEIFRGYFPGLSEPDTVSITSTGNAVFAGDVQMASQNGGPLAGFRNLLINGDFRIWQRGDGLTPVTANTFFASDRFFNRGTNGTGGTASVQRVMINGTSRHRYTAEGLTGIASITQRIEAQNAQALAGTTVTLSCYASYIPVFQLSYFDATDTQQTIPFQTGVLVPGETNRYSATFMIPNVQIGNTASARGLEAITYYTTDGNTANFIPDGDYDTWNAQLEVGPVATPFEHRPIGTELALCQRYYQRQSTIGLNTLSSDTTRRWINAPRAVVMRAAPTEETGEASPGTLALSGTADLIIAEATGLATTSACRVTGYTADAEL